MTNTTKQFDVIIIYSGSIANSAKDKKYKEFAPFPPKGRYAIYNDSYEYLFKKCKKLNLSVAFATSKDIIGPGLFKSFWTFDRKWIRNSQKAYSRILFDKFTPVFKKQVEKFKLLTSSKDIHLFNHKALTNIFQNKLNTYTCFKDLTIPTVEITSPSKKDIKSAKIELEKQLKNNKFKGDFVDGFLVKNIIGTGGFKIHRINFDEYGLNEIKKSYTTDTRHTKVLSYILQPFIDCTKGFVFGKYSGLIDLRLIILNHTIIQTYIRIAKKGKFRCNEHQGGNLIYMPLKIIPQDVLAMIKKIINRLDTIMDLKHSLYSLDFIKSNNGNLYFIEGNTSPGIDWNHNKKQNEIKSKELIDIIVGELKSIALDKKTA